MKPRIAFLGIGIMGAPMAANLLKAGYAVTVWNRTVAKAKPLAEHGATVAETPALAASAADVVFTMLADSAAVGDILFRDGVAEALPRGGLVIDTSSIEPARARDHAKRLAAAGIGHLDAPVSGGPSGAEKASLAIMVGGTDADYARGSEVLACLGRPTHVGPPGAGQVAKLANQVIVALAIGAVAEGLLLAARGGADPAAVRQALLGGFADSLILQIHGQRMLDRRFLPGGPARMHLKDLNNIATAAKDAGLTLPLSDGVRQLFQSLVDHGGADYDHSAILLEIERLNPPARLGSQPDTLPD
jgi:2-hydroxy-3-oxopropionate reductase